MRKYIVIILTFSFCYMQGDISGYAIFDYSNISGDDQFDIKRAYFNYSDNISDDLYFKLSLDVGRFSDELIDSHAYCDDTGTDTGESEDTCSGVWVESSINSDTKLSTYLKNAYVDWKFNNGSALSIGLIGNAADLFPKFVQKNIIPDIVTDQTSAHDELQGYVPHNISFKEAVELRGSNPDKYIDLSYVSMGIHCQAMLDLQNRGSIVFDYGNNLRGQAKDNAGIENAFDYPGFVPEYIRPLFCEGKGPFRWVALSGNPEDIYKTDKKVLELFPQDEALKRWINMAQKKVKFQGLPSRICWLGYKERNLFGEAINDMVKSGELDAPIVIGRDHLDCGSVASPNRETENMKDGSDSVADWPILNSLLSTSGGASWVSLHNGGGVGIGLSIHAGLVIVADGTLEMKKRINRVLTNDPGIGVARHVDAGYKKAIEIAKERKLKIPN